MSAGDKWEESTTFLYIVKRSDSLIKIGCTGNVERRMSQLTREHGYLIPLALMHGSWEDERELHKAFRKSRVMGEWFNASADLHQFIVEHQEIEFPPMPKRTKKRDLRQKYTEERWRRRLSA